MVGLFLMGLTFSLYVHPSATYSWMWHQVRDSSQQFVVGLLDITKSRFGDEWKVLEGGNHTVDLARMLPGDARQLQATLSRGDSDLDFFYKIVASVTNREQPEAAQKLEEVLRMRILQGKEELYDGLVRDLKPAEFGPNLRHETEGLFLADEGDKSFLITVYLPREGVDHQYQSLRGEVEIRFLAKQATSDAIYAE
ncbi:hypothetical protein T458_14125 [Brevibacillus panacihumi W25]|uniref:Uncharacterized protein n=1 Tax=Brevibacillus panacihumi W25 TaxID=1408254 RepID=V6M9S0_9BACL|nr:hypothetical protein [Brevibacillus panacihumi]EST54615.1 hypothetical protein T458_14125 [Brevibacillus panacihumi W25]